MSNTEKTLTVLVVILLVVLASANVTSTLVCLLCAGVIICMTWDVVLGLVALAVGGIVWVVATVVLGVLGWVCLVDETYRRVRRAYRRSRMAKQSPELS